MVDKIKLALYWGGTCGGCDVAVLDIDENILDVAALADVVFWPIAMDFKVSDVEAMADQEITCSIYNGVIRNTENLHMAKLLRLREGVPRHRLDGQPRLRHPPDLTGGARGDGHAA